MFYTKSCFLVYVILFAVSPLQTMQSNRFSSLRTSAYLKPQQEQEIKTELEPILKEETKSESELKLNSNSKTEPEMKLESEPNLSSESYFKPEYESNSELEPNFEEELKTKQKIETKPELKLKIESKPMQQKEPNLKTKPTLKQDQTSGMKLELVSKPVFIPNLDLPTKLKEKPELIPDLIPSIQQETKMEPEPELNLKQEHKWRLNLQPQTELIREPKSEFKPESKFKSELKPETQLNLEQQLESKPDLMIKPVLKSKLELKPELETKVRLDFQPKLKSDFELKSELKPQLSLELQTEPKLDYGLISESKSTKVESELNLKPKSALDLKLEPTSKIDLLSDLQLESKLGPETHLKLELQLEPKTESELKSESKLKLESIPKLESKTQQKSQLESELEPEPQVNLELQLEPTPELDPEPELTPEPKYKTNKTCRTVYDEVLMPEKIIRWLSDPCRYDKTMAPGKLSRELPIIVSTRIHVYYLTAVYPRNLDFKVRMLLQFRWKDNRLAYNHLSPTETSEVVCQKGILERIWMPNVYITNERHSLTLADLTEDLLVTAMPDGNVMLSVRLKTSVFCWVKLGRFPFDRQQCHLIMESWRYDTSQLALEWEVISPVTAAVTDNSWVPYLTEYKLLKIIPHSADHYIEPTALDPTSTYRYTSLTLTFLLAREYGFYIMDYYVPGILLVTISWVSFWMAPDATPARVAIGTSTMLTYFQLGVETGSKLPNVSYIRSNDLWFIVCTVFIFLSLAEFAFVNTIWRYGRYPVKLKNKSNKQMFKSSIKASKMARAKNTANLNSAGPFLNRRQNDGTTELKSELPYTMEMKAMGKVKFKVSEEYDRQLHGGLTTTAQQISIWIDEKSRIAFPVSFVIFNAIYWSLLWI